jgi:cytoskeletal protein CcmA (bactofilin family)
MLLLIHAAHHPGVKGMFNKKEEHGTINKSVAPSVTGSDVKVRSVSVIGPTLKFKGELSANEDLLIEGQIEGVIAHQKKNLTVGKQGRVKANIHAMSVEVLGEVDGDIRGDKVVRLASSAVVNGNIECGRIVMEDGAAFCGHITMTEALAETKPDASIRIAEPAPKEKAHGASQGAA